MDYVSIDVMKYHPVCEILIFHLADKSTTKREIPMTCDNDSFMRQLGELEGYVYSLSENFRLSEDVHEGFAELVNHLARVKQTGDTSRRIQPLRITA